MEIKIGTRKSALAIAQTQIVIDEIKNKYPEVKCTIVEISTQGDRILDKPLLDFGGKGVFVTEFETAIFEGRIDIAVHSGKDLPTEIAKGLEIVATPKREDASDVIVSSLEKPFLPADGGVIGTGSGRRARQITEMYSKIQCKGIRGNVGTRIKKMENGEFDAVILAAAGIKRLKISQNNFIYLEPKKFIPAAAQGIIAVEGRCGSKVSDMLKAISHENTEISFNAERKVLQLIGANCHEAVGIYSYIENGKINIYGFLGDSGTKCVTEAAENWKEAAEKLAGELK